MFTNLYDARIAFFLIAIIFLNLWSLVWWFRIGCKRNNKSSKLKMILSSFICLVVGSIIIGLYGVLINDERLVIFGCLTLPCGIAFGIYAKGAETGEFHRYDGFWSYVFGCITWMIIWGFVVYVKYIEKG